MASEFPLFSNRYWVLRHGRSIPNEHGLIVSHLSNGSLQEHGLSPVGFAQAKAAGELFLKEFQEEGILLEDVRIFSSPFSRTRDTAHTVAEVLNLNSDAPYMQVLEELRERYFGPVLELQSHEHYPEIWALDEHDPFVGPTGGESVADVATRVIKALGSIERECQGCAVLIVSHGDTLQILQSVANVSLTKNLKIGGDLQQGQPEEIFKECILSRHRTYALLTGELRRLM